MLRGVVRARADSAFSQVPHRRNRRSSAPKPRPPTPGGQYFGAWRESGRWGRGRAARREAVETAGAAPVGGSDRCTGPTSTRRHDHVRARLRPHRGAAGSRAPARFRLGDLTPLLLVAVRTPPPGRCVTCGRHDRRRRAGRTTRSRAAADRSRTVLVGQADPRLVQRPGRPRARRPTPAHRQAIADGRLDPGTVWFALALAVLPGGAAVARQRAVRRVGVPLSLARRAARAAGLAAQGQPVLASRGRRPSRCTRRSCPTAAGEVRTKGAPPELLITGLAALLGIGVHLLRALWGLVPDNAGRLDLPAAQARAEDRRLRDCSGWPVTYTVLVLVGLAFAGT